MLTLVRRLFGRTREASLPRPGSAPATKAPRRSPLLPPSKSAIDLLENPDLKLDTQDAGFDPYNTGTFNRSGSWERINKRRNG